MVSLKFLTLWKISGIKTREPQFLHHGCDEHNGEIRMREVRVSWGCLGEVSPDNLNFTGKMTYFGVT